MSRRSWSVEEKVAIIEEAEVEGVMATSGSTGYASTYYNWKRKYDSNGVAGLRAKRSESVQRLREESRRLT